MKLPSVIVCIIFSFSEIVKKDGVKSLGSIVDELSQDNIEGLPPGGGIQSK